jgi:hypothetical protein
MYDKGRYHTYLGTAGSMVSEAFEKYSDLEHYLFEEVSPRFQSTQQISAFDFFCIVIWKANRAKSRIAARLLAPAHRHEDLNRAVSALCADLTNAACPRDRLRALLEKWKFLLPMASAILTVLYPTEFTIYDVRVCETLGDFSYLKNRTQYDRVWEGYSAYVARVRSEASHLSLLRDKDRYLWGKSFAQDLRAQITSKFHDGKIPDLAPSEGAA